MATAHNVVDLMPADTPAYMAPAWISCMQWAIGVPEILESFRVDTGMRWTPGRSPIERMINDSTEMSWHFVKAFVEWANVNIWGPMDGPPEGVES